MRINSAGLKDKSSAEPLLKRADQIEAEALKLEAQVLDAVNSNIDL